MRFFKQGDEGENSYKVYQLIGRSKIGKKVNDFDNSHTLSTSVGENDTRSAYESDTLRTFVFLPWFCFMASSSSCLSGARRMASPPSRLCVACEENPRWPMKKCS